MDVSSKNLKAAVSKRRRDASLDALITSAFQTAGLENAAAYVCDLQSGRYGQWCAGLDIYPASIIKVPIMAEVFHQFEMGKLRPDTRVTISAANQTTTAGPAPFVTGHDATVSELVDFMIVYSDNVATNQLIDVVRRESVTKYMHDLGLQTFLLGRKLSGSEPLIDDPEIVGRNRLPADEIGVLLELIALEGIAGAAEQQAILARCDDNNKLLPGLRSTDIFKHKTGETSDTSHDAGILVTADGKNYIVVLYCEVEAKPDGSDAAWVNPHMAAWMRAVRERL